MLALTRFKTVVLSVILSLSILSLEANAITTRVEQSETQVLVETEGFLGMQKGESYRAEIDFKNKLIAASLVEVKFYNDRNAFVGTMTFNLKGHRKTSWFSGNDQVTAAPSTTDPRFVLYYRDITRESLDVTPKGNLFVDETNIRGELNIRAVNGPVMVRVRYSSQQ